MKIFLDTAIVEEVVECASFGLIDGVTTNPSLMAKGGKDPRLVVEELCQIVDGPISAEVLATDYDGMVKEAKSWHRVHENVVVKVPLTGPGLKTVAQLAPEGIQFNVTLCFSLTQALLAAKAGASFISPFVGRWDDIDTPGIELIPEITQIYENYGFETEILVASVRSPLHVSQAALAGAHAVTLPSKVFHQLYHHPLTDIGLAKFLADYRDSQL